MKRKTKNEMLAAFICCNALLAPAFKRNANYYQLTNEEASNLRAWAECFNIKERPGKSKAQTMWERANEGRPF